MRSLFITTIITAIAALLFASCDDEYGARKESTLVIESASINPASFTFGDSVTLAAIISDPATKITAMEYQVVASGRIIATENIPIDNSNADISKRIFIPLVNDMPDNVPVTVTLTVKNVLKGVAGKDIALTGKRPVFGKLYLVTDEGTVVTLTPQSANKDKYEAAGLTLDASFNYKIAEKITSDKQIDYSGAVWGSVNSRIAIIDASGESTFAYTPNATNTQTLVYDNYAFEITSSGGTVGANDILLNSFEFESINSESFRTFSRSLDNNQEYTLYGHLASEKVVYNLDFFERTAPNKVKFLGKTGTYTLYYNPVRKNVIVGLENPEYPDYLLACGYGLGYPTKVNSQEIDAVYPGHQRTHTDWGFNHIMNYVLFRQIGNEIYQGTFYTPGDNDHYAGFKPFENTGWANEKQAGAFTFTGEKIISGDNDWTIPTGETDPVIPSGHYRFTIDMNTKTVHIEKIIL